MRGKISKKKNQITFQFIEVKLRDNEKWLIGHHSINSNFEKVKVTSTLMPYILYLYVSWCLSTRGEGFYDGVQW